MLKADMTVKVDSKMSFTSTGDGPMEVTKEGRGVVMRVPLEGGGRLVVEMTVEEAKELDVQLEVLK